MLYLVERRIINTFIRSKGDGVATKVRELLYEDKNGCRLMAMEMVPVIILEREVRIKQKKENSSPYSCPECNQVKTEENHKKIRINGYSFIASFRACSRCGYTNIPFLTPFQDVRSICKVLCFAFKKRFVHFKKEGNNE